MWDDFMVRWICRTEVSIRMEVLREQRLFPWHPVKEEAVLRVCLLDFLGVSIKVQRGLHVEVPE